MIGFLKVRAASQDMCGGFQLIGLIEFQEEIESFVLVRFFLILAWID